MAGAKNMEWKAEYATGIRSIDQQHQIILRYIARFDEAFADQADWAGVYLLTLRARTFMEYHFCAEQTLMHLLDIPNAAVHCARNRIALEQFSTFQRRVHRDSAGDVLLQPMRQLLLDHVLDGNQLFGDNALDDSLA